MNTVTGLQQFSGNLDKYPSEKSQIVELIKFEKNPTSALKEVIEDRSKVSLKSKFNLYIYENNAHIPEEYYSLQKLYSPFPPTLNAFLNGLKTWSVLSVSSQFVAEMEKHYKVWKESSTKKLLTVKISQEMSDEQDIGENNVEIYYLNKSNNATSESGMLLKTVSQMNINDYGFSIEGKPPKRIPPETLYFSFPILFEDDYKYIIPPEFFSDDVRQFQSQMKVIIDSKDYSFLLEYNRTKLGSLDLTKKVDRLIELMTIYYVKFDIGNSRIETVLSGFDYYLHSYFSALNFVIKYIGEIYNSPEDEGEIRELMNTVKSYDFTEESDLLILLESFSKNLNTKNQRMLESYNLKKLRGLWNYILTMVGIMRDIKELFSLIPNDKTFNLPLKYSLYPNLNSTESKVRSLNKRLDELELSITEPVLNLEGMEGIPERFSIGKKLSLGKIGDEFDFDDEEGEGEGEEGEDEGGEGSGGEDLGSLTGDAQPQPDLLDEQGNQEYQSQSQPQSPSLPPSMEEIQEDKGVFYDIYMFYRKYLNLTFGKGVENIDTVDDMYIYFLMQILFKDKDGLFYPSLLTFQAWPQDSTLRMYPEFNVQAYLGSGEKEKN